MTIVAAEQRCLRIARRQFSLITRRQAQEAGLSEAAIRRRLDGRLFERFLPSVFRVAGSPSSWEQAVFGACLWGGDDAVASHGTAAALWRLLEPPRGAVDISLATRKKAPRGVVVRTGGDLIRRDRTRLGIIPVTSVPRTLIDLAGVVDAEDLEAALDSALIMRRTDLDRVKSRLEMVTTHKHGLGTLQAFVQERLGEFSPTESRLEIKFKSLVKRAGLPSPTNQQTFYDERGLVARVDFLFEPSGVVVELQGYVPHAGARAVNRGHRRHNRLSGLGYRVLYFTWHDVVRTPHYVLETLRAHLAPRLLPMP